MPLSEIQEELCSSSQWDFSDLRALFLNCTLKRSPDVSHTNGLIDVSRAILERNDVTVEVLRPVDYDLAFGVYPDMTEHGREADDWPEIYAKRGCLITGNEDGIKHCSMSILYALQHIGYLIPPQADAGWIGEAGPGPSYLDEGSGGPENEFTQRNTTFMTWNLMHMARLLRTAGGIPAHGNQRSAWEAGCRSDQPNPEHR